jgi:hypothetical protein
MAPTLHGAGRRRGVVAAVGIATVLLLGAGVGGLIHSDHRNGRSGSVVRATDSSPTTDISPANTISSATTGAPVTAAPPTYAPPTDLGAHLLAPADTGGYYRVDAPVAGVDLSGSSCLSALAAPAAPDARAATYLAVGNEGDVPAILEAVDAYPSSAATTAAFAADRADLARCVHLTTTLAGGVTLTTRLRPVVLTPIGDRALAYRGPFTTAGLAESIQIAVVQAPHELLLVIQLDRDPPVAGSAIYDNFPSAVVTAYGKLA